MEFVEKFFLEKPFCFVKHVEGSLFAMLLHSIFLMRDMMRHGMTMGLRM